MSQNPEPLPDELASSARRRLLLRGGLKAAPLAMTLVGASAIGQTAVSSSTACLARQPANPATEPGTTFVSVPILRFGNGNGNNSADFVSGADLQAVATAQGTSLTFTGTNGTALTSTGLVALRIGTQSGFAGVSPGNVIAANDPRVTAAGAATQAGTVIVRIDASGNVIGFFYASNASIGGTGGTALSASCQSSFINRPR